jgi:hypothetical protein
MKKMEEELKQEVPAEENLRQNTELRDDMSRLGMASLKKGSEYEALKAQVHAKWGSPTESSQTAAA